MPKPLYQHLTAPQFVEGLGARPPAELRSMRAECEQVEAAISFARRALHGRLDIVHAELRRRLEGAENPRLDDLVAQLPAILAETQPTAAAASQRVLLTPDASPVQDELMAVVDHVAGPDALAHLSRLDEEALSQTVGELTRLEQELSSARRQLHRQIDVLQAELTARYERGELDVEALLT